MEQEQSEGRWADLKSNYAQHLASGVDLPDWAARSFSSSELAVLGVVRDTAYKTLDGVSCPLTVSEIARLAEVGSRTAARAITIAIAAGVIEREGNYLVNRHIHYKVGEIRAGEAVASSCSRVNGRVAVSGSVTAVEQLNVQGAVEAPL